MSKKYPIHECFHTWQGEGVHMGRAAYFIRTFGCPVHCPWCDSAGTWHPDYIPEKVPRYSADALAELARREPAAIAVVTGGEPAVHDLGPLANALRDAGLPAHLETSGGFPIRGEPDWMTVSPKWWKMPLRENIERADELKIIVEDVHSVEKWWEAIGDWVRTAHVWLHPEWSRRGDTEVLASISAAVKAGGSRFRAGYQLHKLYRVDAEDPGVQPPAPLGGDPGLGY